MHPTQSLSILTSFTQAGLARRILRINQVQLTDWIIRKKVMKYACLQRLLPTRRQLSSHKTWRNSKTSNGIHFDKNLHLCICMSLLSSCSKPSKNLRSPGAPHLLELRAGYMYQKPLENNFNRFRGSEDQILWKCLASVMLALPLAPVIAEHLKLQKLAEFQLCFDKSLGLWSPTKQTLVIHFATEF